MSTRDRAEFTPDAVPINASSDELPCDYDSMMHHCSISSLAHKSPIKICVANYLGLELHEDF